MPKIDAPIHEATTPQDSHVWVTVPDIDLFDMAFPDISLNGIHYGPGRHYVTKELHDEILWRVKLYEKSCVRLLQPKPDTAAINTVSNHGSGKRAGGNFADPNDTTFRQ